MKVSLINTFASTKHALIRRCATNLAVLEAITYDPGTAFLELDDAALTVKLLESSIERSLTLLSDPRTVAYLKSL